MKIKTNGEKGAMLIIISMVIYGTIGVSLAFLRESNRILVAPFVSGESYVIGWYEPIIVGVPLIMGFLLGICALKYWQLVHK